MTPPPTRPPPPPPQFRLVADPFSTPPLKLSLPTVEWLVTSAKLDVANASPFGFLLHTKSKSTSRQRTDGAATELSRHGIPLGDTQQRPSEKGALYKQAIEVLAQPEARLAITFLEPGKVAVLLNVFLKGDLAALGWFDQEAFYVGAPVGRGPLAKALVKKLKAAPEAPSPRDVTVWPSLLRTVTRLWAGLALDAALEESRARGLLETHLKLVAADAAQAVDALVSTGLVTRESGRLLLAAKFRPFLASLWSQHIVELEYAVLPPGPQGDLSRLAASTERLVFVGPPGKRVLVGGLTGEDLKAETSTPPAQLPEGALVTLTALGAADTEAAIREFLRVG